MMMLLGIVSAIVCLRSLKLLSILLTGVLATIIAGFYFWRRERLARRIFSSPNAAVRNRLLSKHLRLSIDMTMHFSLLPKSESCGYQLSHRLMSLSSIRSIDMPSL